MAYKFTNEIMSACQYISDVIQGMLSVSTPRPEDPVYSKLQQIKNHTDEAFRLAQEIDHIVNIR